ncbi:Activating signal cointegrator 1 complex subunit 1 [Acropora cervicornis]|uniref:Activating signal cointegrator 1 complex subunit 1 n=1 Tax=Acropora cervicornis TaxID=6130 RepID=A0AAD9R523_ACRCE|nr:Activating signal cointegrator 1 complex subunit 1 [Acropora cervicornis]
MDVMKPTLIYIGGRCHRKMPFEQRTEHREPLEQDNNGGSDAFGMVEKTEQGYKLCMQVPSLLYKFIIGKKGETKKKIEKETGTRIIIPRQGEFGDLVITGPQRSGVVGARSRIEVITESSRQKIPFTHFLSFPLHKNGMENKIDEFKVKVLKDCFERNASDFLSQCYQELVRQECHIILLNKHLQNRPVVVELKGVECMNDDPSEVDVLYAKVTTKDGSDRLQKLADGVVEKFVAHGLMKKEYEKLFEDFSFGEYHLDTIHLSTRGTYDADGHYECAAAVPLP